MHLNRELGGSIDSEVMHRFRSYASSHPQTLLRRIPRKQVYHQVCSSGRGFRAKDTYLVNKYFTSMEVNEICLESTKTRD